MKKDKYIFINPYSPQCSYESIILSESEKKSLYDMDKYFNSKLYKIFLLQSEFNKMLLKEKLSSHLKKSSLLYINKQNIQNSVKHYLDICKEFNFKSFSDITENKCILDSSGNPINDINSVRIDISEVNTELLEMLSKHPDYLYQLSSRKFEEVVAEIMIRMGYAIELTPSTHDGGKDIYVAHKNNLGSFLYLIECKQYSPTQKVGVKVVRDLYGVVSSENATCGIIVTTSYFTKPAKDFQEKIPFRMALHDFESLKNWLYDVTELNN